MRYFKFPLVFILLISPFANTFSQDAVKKPRPLRFLIVSALELGGDKVAEVYFTNGDKQAVRAGQGISLGVGGELRIPGADRFLLRASAGFKYVTTAADNAHIRLTRIPVIISGSYMVAPKLRIGAGLSMHRNIQFKTDGLGDNYRLQNANGPVFEIAYSGVGLIITAMKYKDGSGNVYAASSIGISYSIALPNK